MKPDDRPASRSPTAITYITLSYLNGDLSSITDGFGRTIQFQYQDGRMVSVTDPAGGNIQYQYNSAGKLAEVIYQDNTSRSLSLR